MARVDYSNDLSEAYNRMDTPDTPMRKYAEGGITEKINLMSDSVGQLSEQFQQLVDKIRPILNDDISDTAQKSRPDVSERSGMSQELSSLDSRLRDLRFYISSTIDRVDL